MNHGDVLVIGGTSDARAICQQLDAADVRYTLSVATPTGERLAGDIRGQIRCGRMEWQQMAEWLRAQRTRWVIDASHPYAEVVSQNIVRACASVGVLLSRYQRPEQLSDLRHPLLHVVGDLNEACAVARRLGERILLTTGSKDLAAWRAGLAEKTLLARVLPVPEVVPISTIGSGGFFQAFLKKPSRSSPGLAASAAMAFAASRGEPPPIPTTNAAFFSAAKAAASSQEESRGFSVIPSYTVQEIFPRRSTSVRSSRAPLAFAERLPVTTIQESPSFFSWAALSARAVLPLTTLTGI